MTRYRVVQDVPGVTNPLRVSRVTHPTIEAAEIERRKLDRAECQTMRVVAV